MQGDLTDIVARLRLALPKRWFAESSPNLVSLLTSIATPWVWLVQLVTYVTQQSRLSTAFDGWLDLIAFDFFGNSLRRKLNETDLALRQRIQMALLREAASRAAVSDGLTQLLGTQPAIFEPGNCGDAGSYGSLAFARNPAGNGTAYGLAGGWGSLQYPFQFFITARRPATPGLGMVAGYGTPPGGYGVGTINYVDLSLLPGNVTDIDIQAAVCNLIPANTIAWLRII